ncbi:HAD family hydrolase [Mycoplasma putrefaciens]|uniref:Cof-type HAD-IIB family hydrolase n=1 Tax=Mycoplasma putrefaciens TaxID=2123 RepID=UPI003DA5D197
MSLKNIKLIVTDLDGTVLQHGKLANDFDQKVFQLANQKGVYVTIATGQGYKSAKPRAELFEIEKHLDLAVLSNGAMISKISEFKPIYVNNITSHIVYKMVKKLTEMKICVVVFTASIADVYWNQIPFVVESMNQRNWFDRFNKIVCSTDSEFEFKNVVQLMTFVPENQQQEFEEWFYQESMDKHLTIMKNNIESMPIYEFTNISATKGIAIKKMAEILEIDPEDIIVFGDNMNDMSMFKEISNSVAVGNAVDKIKKIAKYTTESNVDAGVGKFIKKHILED